MSSRDITAIQETASTLTTADAAPPPSQQRTYQSVAETLPSLPAASQNNDVYTPPISDAYTIATDDVAPSDLPFGTDDYNSWRQWRSKYTTIASLYVLAAEFSDFFPNHEAVHLVFSPPKDRITSPSSVKYWRARACEIAEDIGITGGVAAFHGFRVAPATSRVFSDAVSDTEFADTATDVLEWEWIRRGDWRQHTEWGPHVHILGLTDGYTEYADAGIIKELRSFADEPSPVHRIAAHRAVAKDMLDHATFHPDRALPPLSWFGELEGNNGPWEAKQYVTDTRLDQIREILINGPTDPDAVSASQQQQQSSLAD